MLALSERFNKTFRPQGKIFHGWWIVLSAAGIQFTSGLFWMHSYGAYVVLLQEEFAWSAAIVSGAFALTRVESGLLGPIQGWLTDRFGPKLILILGNLLFGISFMLLALVDSVWSFYAVFVLIAVGGSLGGFATAMVSIVHWFRRHRSKAVAGSQLGFSLGGLAVPMLTLVLQWVGWRWTAVLSGLFILVVTTPLSLVMRHSPQEIGEQPDGIPIREPVSLRQALSPMRFTTRQALWTRSFWFLAIGHGVALLTVSAVMVHLLPHLTRSLGFSLTYASTFLPLMFICQVVGQLIGGLLGDRFDKRLLCTGCLISHACSMFFVAFAENVLMVVVFTLLHGFAWGIRAPLLVSLRADYFGAQIFGRILGFTSMITMIGMTIGPLLVGILYDKYENYWIGFTWIGVLALVGSVFFFLAKPPVPVHQPAPSISEKASKR
ncbi:MAG: MFS transporter [Gammaproteobacteria bacterium]|nr:MFS transporter [Gammaproteobacteria bacterium]